MQIWKKMKKGQWNNVKELGVLSATENARNDHYSCLQWSCKPFQSRVAEVRESEFNLVYDFARE